MAEVIVGDDSGETAGAQAAASLAAAALSGEAVAEGRHAQAQAAEADAKAEAALAAASGAAERAEGAAAVSQQSTSEVQESIRAGFAELAASLATVLKPPEPEPEPVVVEPRAEDAPKDVQPKSVRKRSSIREWYANH